VLFWDPGLPCCCCRAVHGLQLNVMMKRLQGCVLLDSLIGFCGMLACCRVACMLHCSHSRKVNTTSVTWLRTVLPVTPASHPASRALHTPASATLLVFNCAQESSANVTVKAGCIHVTAAESIQQLNDGSSATTVLLEHTQRDSTDTGSNILHTHAPSMYASKRLHSTAMLIDGCCWHLAPQPTQASNASRVCCHTLAAGCLPQHSGW
jgi:hypothetical protein